MNKWKRIYLVLTISLVILCTAALLWWYQPWRYWEVEQLTQELTNPKPLVRQQAIATFQTWPNIQQQNLLESQQPILLAQYELAINHAIAQGQWRTAQLWLMDLQKLYPYLPQVQNAQQQVAFNLAQQINIAVTHINSVLVNNKILTLAPLVELTKWQDELRGLAPEHPLVNDSRVLYVILNSIDDALVHQDFVLAEKLSQWAQMRFPNQAALMDREIQIAYRLPGEPVQVLVSCISEGQNCWTISTATPLFSQPWIVQQSFEHPWLVDWNMVPILQGEFGHYYRQRALKSYETQEPMLAAVDLLRAAYFTPPAELDGYWQWLVRAFIERKQEELHQAEIAQLSALQHTLMTQLAAFDLQDAQRSILMLQSTGADQFFIEGIALPLLGDTYLDLAEQLAHTQQYALAVRVLHAGQHFLPRNNEIKLLLAEYTALATKPPVFADVEKKRDQDALEAIWIQEYANALMADAEFVEATTPAVAEIMDPCASILRTVTLSHAGACQDQLADKTTGPALVVVPLNNKLKPFAIGKYPITIREYNNYCKISRACTPRAVPKQKTSIPVIKRAKDLPSDINLADVQEVMQDYDEFCEESGTCNTIEPQPQDLPLTNLNFVDAMKYAQWLTAATGYTYRLPTIDEWKYALYADNGTYTCSYDTLLGLPKELVAVQRGTINEWDVVYQLGFLREWVKTPNGISLVGPEKLVESPVCSIPLDNSTDAAQAAANIGVRLVREIR